MQHLQHLFWSSFRFDHLLNVVQKVNFYIISIVCCHLVRNLSISIRLTLFGWYYLKPICLLSGACHPYHMSTKNSSQKSVVLESSVKPSYCCQSGSIVLVW